jgi:hypothetical protein
MQTNILISQTVSKDNDLLHSMCFILKGEEIIYISKHGGVGEIYHSPLENMFVHYFSTKSEMPYGNKFAFGDWLSLYSDPELHLVFSDFTERLEIRYNEHIAQAELK